jgi:hypothetical protein
VKKHWVTYNGWVYVFGRIVEGNTYAELIASPIGRHCPKLWHLRHWRVSSVSGVVLWLIRRK